MNETILDLKNLGTWYIVPPGDWLDSLRSDARGCCACGHEIAHSYFAALVVNGEIERVVECGSTCVIELTRGYVYRTPSEWVYLTDDQMVSLFWAGHNVGRLGDVDKKTARLFASNPRLTETLNTVTDVVVNQFYASVYDFAYKQYSKTGFARITKRQFESCRVLASR